MSFCSEDGVRQMVWTVSEWSGLESPFVWASLLNYFVLPALSLPLIHITRAAKTLSVQFIWTTDKSQDAISTRLSTMPNQMDQAFKYLVCPLNFTTIRALSVHLAFWCTQISAETSLLCMVEWNCKDNSKDNYHSHDYTDWCGYSCRWFS